MAAVGLTGNTEPEGQAPLPQAGQSAPSDPPEQGGSFAGPPPHNTPVMGATLGGLAASPPDITPGHPVESAMERRDRLAAQEALINEQHARQIGAKREVLEDVGKYLVEARRMLYHCPPSRETSLIATHIEEAMLWTHAAAMTSAASGFGFMITSKDFRLENFLAGQIDGKT